jgi:hypothetical protein
VLTTNRLLKNIKKIINLGGAGVQKIKMFAVGSDLEIPAK